MKGIPFKILRRGCHREGDAAGATAGQWWDPSRKPFVKKGHIRYVPSMLVTYFTEATEEMNGAFNAPWYLDLSNERCLAYNA